ncbi:MAG TPA: polysaccharide biosynthesis/export family protein [Pseudomonadales bacterium]|nr:polysaccharide biosynthesis/export family protein [Pseudomonadales bacterium]
MNIRRHLFAALACAPAIVAVDAGAELPPWWNQSSNGASASSSSDDSKSQAPAAAPAQPNDTPNDSSQARPQPSPSVGPLLEQYSIKPHPVETMDDRARASAAGSSASSYATSSSSPATNSGTVALPAPSVAIANDGVAGDRYGIQPGDLLSISVWREPDLTREVRVSPDGRITYPLVGELDVEGITTDALREQLEKALTRFVTAAVVDVGIKEVMGNRVYVLGKVNRPGMYPFTKSLDVVQALSLAGGTAKFAAIDDIKIIRRVEGQQQAFKFHYSDVERGRDLEQNIVLKSGDVIVVP